MKHVYLLNIDHQRATKLLIKISSNILLLDVQCFFSWHLRHQLVSTGIHGIGIGIGSHAAMRPDTMRPDMPCLLKLCTLGFDCHEPLRWSWWGCCASHTAWRVTRQHSVTASFLICTLGIDACSQSKKWSYIEWIDQNWSMWLYQCCRNLCTAKCHENVCVSLEIDATQRHYKGNVGAICPQHLPCCSTEALGTRNLAVMIWWESTTCHTNSL